MRRSHYENAFEAWMGREAVPFVSVEDARQAVGGRPGIKLFDYLAYPRAGGGFLLDVKGRKAAPARSGATRWECWVTQRDVDGLTEWRGLFGEGFEAGFIFAYWLPQPLLDVGRNGVWLAGRQYIFQLIRLDDYRRAQRRRSPRWGTLYLAREDFDRLAKPAGPVLCGAV